MGDANEDSGEDCLREGWLPLSARAVAVNVAVEPGPAPIVLVILVGFL